MIKDKIPYRLSKIVYENYFKYVEILKYILKRIVHNKSEVNETRSGIEKATDSLLQLQKQLLKVSHKVLQI